jgi:hypothetical protein
MTASPGREVEANLLRRAALGSTQARANTQDAGSQDLGDLVQALGRGHEVSVKRPGPTNRAWLRRTVHAITCAPLLLRKCSDLRASIRITSGSTHAPQAQPAS